MVQSFHPKLVRLDGETLKNTLEKRPSTYQFPSQTGSIRR